MSAWHRLTFARYLFRKACQSLLVMLIHDESCSSHSNRGVARCPLLCQRVLLAAPDIKSVCSALAGKVLWNRPMWQTRPWALCIGPWNEVSITSTPRPGTRRVAECDHPGHVSEKVESARRFVPLSQADVRAIEAKTQPIARASFVFPQLGKKRIGNAATCQLETLPQLILIAIWCTIPIRAEGWWSVARRWEMPG